MAFNPQAFVGALVGAQLAVFGWRINREIALGDARRRTWLPVADWLNVAAMFAVVACCIAWPTVNGGEFDVVSQTALAMAYTLLVWHPITTAAHYRLFSKRGRSIYEKTDYPWITDHEKITLSLSAVNVGAVGLGILAG